MSADYNSNLLLDGKLLIIILILHTGKLILIEFPINWQAMKVTDFVLDFRKYRCTIVYNTLTVCLSLWPS